MKKIKILNIIILFLLSFISHFLYEWFPSSLTSIFFPVNESIFEHMKIIYTSYFVYSIFEYFILIRMKIPFNNFLINVFLTPLLGIIAYLIIYLPLYYIFGENMFISISLLLIIYILMNFISCYILNMEKIKYGEYISIIGIIIVYFIFGFLTYNPPINELFYDKNDNKYGIDIYTE